MGMHLISRIPDKDETADGVEVMLVGDGVQRWWIGMTLTERQRVAKQMQKPSRHCLPHIANLAEYVWRSDDEWKRRRLRFLRRAS